MPHVARGDVESAYGRVVARRTRQHAEPGAVRVVPAPRRPARAAWAWSKTTGRSMKITWFLVMAKSCIIVARGTSTTRVCTTSPTAETRKQVRYGGCS
nr:hypothetical protein [Nonomuraea spiralis]